MTGLDDKDKKIIRLLQDNPHTSQSDIADAADLSQPAISLRIKKLMEDGFISHSIGLDVKKLNLSLAKLEVSLNDGLEPIALTCCPYIFDVLHLTNTARLSLLMVGETESTIHAVTSRLQDRDGLELLHYDTVAIAENKALHPLQLPLTDNKECPHCACASCDHHQQGRCLGCPLTSLYRGELW